MERTENLHLHEQTWSCDRRRFIQAMAMATGSMGMGVVSSRAADERGPRAVSGAGVIVVTAPRGHIGQPLMEHLLQSSARIRVIDRSPARLPEHVRARVEVVEGSHAESSVVDREFEGAGTVFWLCPPDPRAYSVEQAYLEFTRPACEAIRRHRVERVVSVSALGRGTQWAHRAGYVTASLAMDDMLAATGAHFRALACPSFMDNVSRRVKPISAQGVFFSPIPGDLKAPTCATRDIAAAAARLLLDRSWTGVGSVAVLGPEDLSCNDMARIMSDVLNTPIRFQQISLDAFKANMLANGMSEAMAQAMTDMMEAKGLGLDNAEPRTPESTTPTTFRQWCEEVLKPAVRA